MRADDGNRTRMASLEGWGSTIELHPRGRSAQAEQASCVGYRLAPVPARQPQAAAKQTQAISPIGPVFHPGWPPHCPFGTR
jgi:hypothetical protein